VSPRLILASRSPRRREILGWLGIEFEAVDPDVEELTGGALDGESFRDRTHGQRIGIVVDGESVWLYDAEHERWVYTDGTRLSTYATDRQPATPAREPTQVVPDLGHAPTQIVRDGGIGSADGGG
jgi:hypothetical protein